MQFMNKKIAVAPMLILLVLSGALVGAITYFTVDVPSSITVTTEGDLAVTDWEGVSLSTMDFGTLSPGETVSKNIQIKNLSNREVGLIIQSDLSMPWQVEKHDGSEWVHMMPLAAGDSVQIVMTINAPTSAAAGTHSFNFRVMGEA